MAKKFTKDTALAKILKIPEAERILVKYNLPCFGCPLAQYEMENLKIGQVCEMYGIDGQKLIKDLNKVYKE